MSLRMASFLSLLFLILVLSSLFYFNLLYIPFALFFLYLDSIWPSPSIFDAISSLLRKSSVYLSIWASSLSLERYDYAKTECRF